MTIAPGAYVTVTAAPPSPNGNAPTGTWFVAGTTDQGPKGVAIPVTSMTEFVQYCGPRLSSSYLYDSLDEFFHDGGVTAYVSRVVANTSTTAQISISDKATPTPLSTIRVLAAGPGAWSNGAASGIAVIVGTGTVANSYTMTVYNNWNTTTSTGTVVATSPNLFTTADAVTWFGAQNSWVTCVKIGRAHV